AAHRAAGVAGAQGLGNPAHLRGGAVAAQVADVVARAGQADVGLRSRAGVGIGHAGVLLDAGVVAAVLRAAEVREDAAVGRRRAGAAGLGGAVGGGEAAVAAGAGAGDGRAVAVAAAGGRAGLARVAVALIVARARLARRRTGPAGHATAAHVPVVAVDADLL